MTAKVQIIIEEQAIFYRQENAKKQENGAENEKVIRTAKKENKPEEKEGARTAKKENKPEEKAAIAKHS